MVNRKGLVQILIGNGLLDSAIALGTVMRANGYGLRTMVHLFSTKLSPAQDKMVNILDDLKYVNTFKHSIDKDNIPTVSEIAPSVQEGNCDLVVLDQILSLVSLGFVDKGLILEIIALKHPQTELILTGNLYDESLINTADLVTECEVK